MSEIRIPLQTDRRLLKPIQEYGCLFLSYLRVTSIVQWHEWTPYQINLAYWAAVHNKWIQDNCRVIQPDRILESLGVQLDGWVRHENPDYRPQSREIQIEQWHNTRTDHTHFILGEPYRWDSLGDSVTVQEGSIQRKIIIRLDRSVKGIGG